MENMLGIGPGAVSEINGYVFKNINPIEYLDKKTKIDEASIKRRKEKNLKAMFLVKSLRYFINENTNGMLVEDYKKKFGSLPIEDFKEEINFMKKTGLIKATQKKIEITSKGILFTQWINNFLTRHYT
jgi:coproporphyrinogen III oxidase-like Fe-S oxidoreductase